MWHVLNVATVLTAHILRAVVRVWRFFLICDLVLIGEYLSPLKLIEELFVFLLDVHVSLL